MEKVESFYKEYEDLFEEYLDNVSVFDILKVDQKINWLQLKNGPLFLHNIQVHDRMYLEV